MKNFVLGLASFACVVSMIISSASAQEIPANLQTKNLVAWCLVPFDAKKRGPEARAKMLTKLGFKKFAYDWRDEHIPTWDEEYQQLKEHGIELTAFWSASSLTPAEHPKNKQIFDFVRRNQVKTQLWFMLPTRELDAIEDEGERIATAAKAVRELALAADKLDCEVGLYNHGGWVGQPSSLVSIMEQLQDLSNVGIVYNFHHAHEDFDTFPQSLESLRPYLMCLNLNGMTPEGPKIQTIGEGEEDRQVMRWILDLDYKGPIGILDHRNELDAEQSLQMNLSGLSKLVRELAK